MSGWRKYVGGGLLLGGGVAAAGAAWFVSRKSAATQVAVQKAIAGTDGPPVKNADTGTVESGGGKAKIHVTGYWPYAARDDEKKMEGGKNDRLGHPIMTLEMHLRDPQKYPYVSVSGDPEIWPAGQRISLSAWPSAVFRVVDMGSHFTGSHKVYRVVGEEPLDVAVDSSATPVPKSQVATIFPGDTFASKKGPREVATSKFKDQTVTLTGEVNPVGHGIRDGRAYGPYGMGYYYAEGGGDLPYGPSGEKLPSKDYDFQPGPDGSYLHGRGGPLKLAEGVTMCDERGNWSRGKIVAQSGEDADVEALARAVESEMGGRSRDEQVATAWALRNRAVDQGTTVSALLAPNGTYGSPKKSGGFCSTRRVPTDASRTVAVQVLAAAPAADPTGGAVDFWVPEQQSKMRALGDAHRAALVSGDEEKAARYERYADYGTENDVRLQHLRDGVCVVRTCGVVELLGKM